MEPFESTPRRLHLANGFDWQFINWHFHHFTGSNPEVYSSTNLGTLYKGLVRDVTKNFKHLRQTRHTHHPVDDAKGNAEALLAMRDEMGLKIILQAARGVHGQECAPRAATRPTAATPCSAALCANQGSAAR